MIGTPATLGVTLAPVLGGVFGLLAGLVFAAYGVPLVIRARQVSRWRRLGKGVIALTYDDGPDPVTTRAVAALLADLDVRATFYLVGFRAERTPDAIDELVGHGHELGTHTHRHKNAWKMGPVREIRDANRAYRTLDAWVGADAPYRPPFGKISLPTWASMRRRGRRVDWWNTATLDTLDTFPDPEALAASIVEAGGPVVLMHCHHAEAHRRAFVLDLTRALVDRARGAGLRLVTVSELEAMCR